MSVKSHAGRCGGQAEEVRQQRGALVRQEAFRMKLDAFERGGTVRAEGARAGAEAPPLRAPGESMAAG